jgi:DNA-binding transcriptional ArsR family regulator
MIDRRLIGLASDPNRLAALALLDDRSAGVGEVAEALELDVTVVARLLDQMHDIGLIEVVGETLNRGAVEPRYRALGRMLWDDKDWAALGLEERKRLTVWVIEMINSDISEAVESGTFAARQDSHASRSISLVDEQGWEELRQIHGDALDAVFAVEASSAERLGEKGEQGFPVLSVLLCCELPPRDAAETS